MKRLCFFYAMRLCYELSYVSDMDNIDRFSMVLLVDQVGVGYLCYRCCLLCQSLWTSLIWLSLDGEPGGPRLAIFTCTNVLPFWARWSFRILQRKSIIQTTFHIHYRTLTAGSAMPTEPGDLFRVQVNMVCNILAYKPFSILS